MTYVVARNLIESWHSLIRAVKSDGSAIVARGIEALELENVSVDYPKVTDYTFILPARRINPVFHLVELFYFLNGRSDEMLSSYVGAMEEFVNESTGRFDGSYGPAIYESLPFVISQLSADNDSRRAVVPILGRHHLIESSKDIPCNVILGFRIRKRLLNMTVVTRSQDLYRGFIYDTLEFQLLQRLLANLFGIGVGSYRHNIFSLHLYAVDSTKVSSVNFTPNLTFEKDLPTLPRFSTAREFWQYTRSTCIFAEYPDFHLLNGIHDDIAHAIVAWKNRFVPPEYGIYTKWVKWWLENAKKK